MTTKLPLHDAQLMSWTPAHDDRNSTLDSDIGCPSIEHDVRKTPQRDALTQIRKPYNAGCSLLARSLLVRLPCMHRCVPHMCCAGGQIQIFDFARPFLQAIDLDAVDHLARAVMNAYSCKCAHGLKSHVHCAKRTHGSEWSGN